MLIKNTALAALVILLVFGSILGGCNQGVIETSGNNTLTNTNSAKTWYQKVVNELKALQPIEVPENLKLADGIKNGQEFDVNKYFSALTHLSMQEGYVLDYVYLSDGSAGGPILYVRLADAIPFASYEEYKEATHLNPRQENDKSLIWLVKDAATGLFGNKITTDNTKEAYFEYAVLQILGNQFYLLGGARINDKQIVCEEAEIENLFNELEVSGNITINENVKKTARKIEFKPEIDISEKLVTISLVTFSSWEGFVRHTVVMSRNYPYLILEQKTKVELY